MWGVIPREQADLAARPLDVASQSREINPDTLRLRSWRVGCYGTPLFRVQLVASWGKALVWDGPQGLEKKRRDGGTSFAEEALSKLWKSWNTSNEP